MAWLIIVISLSWEPNRSAIVNIIGGLTVFIFLGLAYLVPAWLMFRR